MGRSAVRAGPVWCVLVGGVCGVGGGLGETFGTKVVLVKPSAAVAYVFVVNDATFVCVDEVRVQGCVRVALVPL